MIIDLTVSVPPSAINVHDCLPPCTCNELLTDMDFHFLLPLIFVGTSVPNHFGETGTYLDAELHVSAHINHYVLHSFILFQVKVSDYIGKKYVILFFYPLDFTFVCPTGLLCIATDDMLNELCLWFIIHLFSVFFCVEITAFSD